MTPSLWSMISAKSVTTASAVRATYNMARQLIEDDVPGDFVECGVYLGSHPAVMAHAIMEAGQVGKRKVHLFDSFQGIPMCSVKDQTWHQAQPLDRPIGVPGIAERTSSGISVASRKEVEGKMRSWKVDASILVYHAGWYHDILPKAEIGPIALLRLDADLYESTRICMEYLYPKVVKDGWCICDDWTLDGCREAVSPYLLLNWVCPVYWRKP